MINLPLFKATLDEQAPPAYLSVFLKALWLDGNNQFDAAHALIQDIDSADAAWIHAYLHRKEGDEGNARYWYNRAKQPFPEITLAEEWELLVIFFCRRNS